MSAMIPRERCFACGRKLGKLPFLVDTRDAQQVYVGSECAKLITAAGAAGWQPPKGGPRLWLINGPTDWMTRFRAGLALMCGGNVPPLDLCQEWRDNVQVNGEDRLQAWAVSHAAPHWATGIGTLEAAQVWANTPVEDANHED